MPETLASAFLSSIILFLENSQNNFILLPNVVLSSPMPLL